MRGPGRLIASLTTAIFLCLIASIMDHPGFKASASTSFFTASEWVDANTRNSGCKCTASSKLNCGQSCFESTTETAPAYSSTFAMNVFFPTDINGSVQTTN